MKRYKFKDGQQGSVQWHAANEVYGEFRSDTGAIFTVGQNEVRALDVVGPAPHKRVWYATVQCADGVIIKVE